MTGRRGPGRITNPPSRTNRRSSNSFFTSPFTGTSLFPGGAVGINGINSIATPGNLGVEAAIDPATQWNLALAERVLTNAGGIFPGGGFYLLTGGGAYAVPDGLPDNEQSTPSQQQQQPPVIVLQQAPPPAPATALSNLRRLGGACRSALAGRRPIYAGAPRRKADRSGGIHPHRRQNRLHYR